MSVSTKYLMGLMALFAAMIALPVTSSAQNVAPNPGLAYATAQVSFTIKSPGWDFGTCDVKDDGGNYNLAGLPPHPLVSAWVSFGDVVQSREGTITYNQHFVWTGGAVVPTLVFSHMEQAFGYTEFFGQSAHAIANLTVLFMNLPAEITLLPSIVWPLQSDIDSNGSTFNISGGSNFVVTAVVEADVSTP